jgi:DNA gyrase subunit B
LENSSEGFEPKVQPATDGPNKPPRTPGTRVGAGETPGWSDIETIRMRPAIFIGSTTEPGLHRLIYDLVLRIANGFDERCHVVLCINGDSSVTVSVDKTDCLTAKTLFELSESSLNSSFMTLPVKDPDRPYRWSEYRGAFPLAVVNALSEYLQVEVVHNGCDYRKRFDKGISTCNLSSQVSQKADSISITLRPDDEIFNFQDEEGNSKPVILSRKAFSSRLRETAYLNYGRKFSLKDYRPLADIESEEFQFDDGVSQYVQYLNENRKSLHDQPIYMATTVDQVFIECALQWTDAYSNSIYSFVNGVSTTEGGTHVSGFSSAVRRSLTDYGRANTVIAASEMMLYFDDFAEGLTAIINVRMDRPELTGNLLECLSNPEVREIADRLVAEGLWAWLKEHPTEAELILRKGLSAAEYNRKSRR